MTTPRLTAIGKKLRTDPDAFGTLPDCNHLLDDAPALMRSLREEGYIYLRGLLDIERVANARHQVLEWLSAEGLLHPDHPIEEAVAAPGVESGFTPEQRRFDSVRRLTHSRESLDFYSRLLGGEALVLDYIWMRLMSPGKATGPHYDIVYHGRGTPDVFTAWMPLGDVPMSHGPLIVMERSHRLDELRRTYGSMDIDRDNNWRKVRFRHGRFFRGGDYSRNPRAVQRQFGLRWLTTDFSAGDIVIFTAHTMHGSADNVSDRFRVSTDTRFQLASEPIDERWVGEDPIAHSRAE